MVVADAVIGPIRRELPGGVRRSRRGAPSSRPGAWRGRSPGPAASSRFGRGAARSRSAWSRRRNATGSSSRRTRRARSPLPAQHRPPAAATGTARRSPATPGSVTRPGWRRRRVIAGSTERSTPTQVRTTNGTAIRAWPTGTSHHDARQSTGAVSNVISMPNPIVTADVASGSIRPPSSARPARPAPMIARLASAPITTANAVAQAAFVSELAMASTGSMPMRMPGRISARPRSVQAVVDHPVGVENDRSTSATSGAAATSSDAPATSVDESSLASRAGTTPSGRRQQPDRLSVAALGDGRPRHERDQHGELQQRQHRGAADVAELGRPSPHLDLDRAGAGRAEDADHAVRREREQEHDRRRGGHRRAGPAAARSGSRPSTARRRAWQRRPPCRSVGVPTATRPPARPRRG